MEILISPLLCIHLITVVFLLDANQYIKVVQSVGSILEVYDSDKMLPILGFGAKLPGWQEVSHCFALNGNIFRPEVMGIQSALKVYENSLRKVVLSGPTYFAPIIRTIAEITKANPNSYMVFLLLTDGVILDLNETIEEIVKDSVLPLSIVIVGVGDDNFEAMKILDSDKGTLTTASGECAKRDIVQFVIFHDYGSDCIKLAEETLREIPSQFMKYMENANIPITPSQQSVDYFEVKKSQLAGHLQGQGYDANKVNEILSIGIPIDNPAWVVRSMNTQNYKNPMA